MNLWFFGWILGCYVDSVSGGVVVEKGVLWIVKNFDVCYVGKFE